MTLLAGDLTSHMGTLDDKTMELAWKQALGILPRNGITMTPQHLES